MIFQHSFDGCQLLRIRENISVEQLYKSPNSLLTNKITLLMNYQYLGGEMDKLTLILNLHVLSACVLITSNY